MSSFSSTVPPPLPPPPLPSPSRFHGLLLLSSAVCCCLLVVVALVVPGGHYKTSTASCGLFACSSDCPSRVRLTRAARGTGVTSALLLGAGAAGYAAVLGMWRRYAPLLVGSFKLQRAAFLAAASFTALTWCFQALAFSCTLCERKLSDAPGAIVGPGTFLLVASMCLQVLVAYILGRWRQQQEQQQQQQQQHPMSEPWLPPSHPSSLPPKTHSQHHLKQFYEIVVAPPPLRA